MKKINEITREEKNLFGYPSDEDLKQIEPFIKWCEENVKSYLWSEAHCFHLGYHVGGISDCGVELNNGEYAIIDFKSSKTAYKSQFVQIAGYALQIEQNGVFSPDGLHNKKYNKSFMQYIVFPFGADKPTAEIRKDVDKLKNAFINCVSLYRFIELDF